MRFNDDDKIINIISEDVSTDENSETFQEGKVEVKVISCPDEAPLAETNFNVMYQLTSLGSGEDRPGLDLITVLDLSGNMGTEKLDIMKMAMEFVISKLSPIDRLSVVKFSSTAERVCRLRQITKESQAEIKSHVNALMSNGHTNMASGLETAIEVLRDRRFKTGRTAAIMLMSDGAENIRKAADIMFDEVPVFTFGFGTDYDPKVLSDIARKTNATFSDVRKQDDLGKALVQCLGGFHTVDVEDLEVTFKSLKSTIIKVSAGTYRQVLNGNSVTVKFGNLYIKEARKVIVELLLPPVTGQSSADVLEITYKYKSPKDPRTVEGTPIIIRARRKGIAQMPERTEMMFEKSRIRTSEMMKEARILADQAKLKEAKEKLAEAQNLLDDIVSDEPNRETEMMKYELNELVDTMESGELYAKEGRPFALASEISHDLQRYAARGDLNSLRMFATPRMDKYLMQVEAFEEDPTQTLPTEEEDVKEDLAADPLAPTAGPLRFHIQNSTESPEAID